MEQTEIKANQNQNARKTKTNIETTRSIKVNRNSVLWQLKQQPSTENHQKQHKLTKRQTRKTTKLTNIDPKQAEIKTKQQIVNHRNHHKRQNFRKLPTHLNLWPI